MGLSIVEPKKINTVSTNTAQTKRNEVLVCNQNAALPKTDKGIRKKKIKYQEPQALCIV